MLKSKNDLSWNTTKGEKTIYGYLKKYVENHSTEETILEFKSLFIEARSSNALVRDTLENILYSKIDKEKFSYILNYCFYIIINNWIGDENKHSDILSLLALFDRIDFTTKCYGRRKQKIVPLTKIFIESKYYSKLKRIAVVIEPETNKEIDKQSVIRSLIARYTYLYKNLLLGKESINEVSKLIKELNLNRKKIFEFRLAQHIIYRSRLVEIARARQLSSGAGKIIRRIPNPTLLSDKELKIAFKQHVRKLNKEITLFQLSQKFILEQKKEKSYREFKRNLYNYLIFSIESRNTRYNFTGKVWQIIDNIYYQSDTLIVNDSLILRTCRKLYQCLIISNAESNRHDLLIQLITNLGTAQTVMLLVKIVLICPQAKADLEQRLAILFSYYEMKTIEEIPWLVKLLEHFLVAFSIYFGEMDITLAKTI